LDPLHSIYVDQWDWERIIVTQQRNPEFLKWVVGQIYEAIKETEAAICERFGLPTLLPQQIQFATTDELELAYPKLDRKDRENRATCDAGAVFLMKIGGKLKDGQPHDGRAPDYDDWSLNGDILVWNPILNIAFELSSMGIRVDKGALVRQLQERGEEGRLNLLFHRMLMNDELPLTIGGGIGQSRLCMQLLRKAHIGEVHSAWWPQEILEDAKKHGVVLL
jgi:aspartate--ammonia ligase